MNKLFRSKQRVLAFLLTLALLFTSTCAAYASDAPPSTNDDAAVCDEDLFIDSEVAACIAELFVADTSLNTSGMTCWNENTKPVTTEALFDEMGENITAYAVELTEGYVIVSAYIDVPNIILEWADEGSPIFMEAEQKARCANTEKIVYAGPFDYFLDTGETSLMSCTGEEVDRNSVTNIMQELRDAENVDEDVLQFVLEEKSSSITTFATPPDNTAGGYVTNPALYAANVYGGSWSCKGWKNYWTPEASFITASAVPGRQYHCGPLAITNLIKMYGKKYSKSTINNMSYTAVFNKVISVSKSGLFYYYDESIGGTRPLEADVFIKRAFDACGGNIDTYGLDDPYELSPVNLTNALGTSNRLMYCMTYKAVSPFEMAHHFVGYAYVVYGCSGKSDKYFLKVADGVHGTGRFLDYKTLKDGDYWEVYCKP